jgi:hypothetical protein
VQGVETLPSSSRPFKGGQLDAADGVDDFSSDLPRERAGFLLLWSDRPRALSQKERLWAAALASKLQSHL